MKTYEEMKAMTTEDLVRYAMELQDKAARLENDAAAYKNGWSETDRKLDALKKAISSIAELA